MKLFSEYLSEYGLEYKKEKWGTPISETMTEKIVEYVKEEWMGSGKGETEFFRSLMESFFEKDGFLSVSDEKIFIQKNKLGENHQKFPEWVFSCFTIRSFYFEQKHNFYARRISSVQFINLYNEFIRRDEDFVNFLDPGNGLKRIFEKGTAEAKLFECFQNELAELIEKYNNSKPKIEFEKRLIEMFKTEFDDKLENERNKMVIKTMGTV